MAVSERAITVGDVKLTIAEAGAGQRALMLVHGFTGAKEDFTHWLDQLAAAGWHAVAPDLRGHGASDKPADESAYSFELFAADCLGLADALGWDQFVLLGHSMGGMIAQFMALAAANRLNGLVLMDTAHGALDNLDPELVQAAVGIVRDQGIDALADILADNDGPLVTPAHRRLLEERAGYREFEDGKFRAVSPSMYAGMAPVFRQAPDRLDQLRLAVADALPVLVIVGAQDEPFIRHSQRLAESLGDSTLAVIPDAGHCPQFENADAWWQALSGFLATIPG